MEDIVWGGIMFMRPLCGKEGLGWDYKVLDFWLWEVLPFVTLFAAILGAVYTICHFYCNGKNNAGLRAMTALNCSMLLLCIVCVLSIVCLLVWL